MAKFYSFIVIVIGLFLFFAALKSENIVHFWICYIGAMFILIVPAENHWRAFFERWWK